MKVNASVYQDPTDNSFIVHTEMVENDVKAGEFFLPGGTTIDEAEDLARSLIKLAESGFDMLKLMPEG